MIRVYDLGQNLKMSKTSQLHSIHQENTSKLCLHSNFIISNDFHSFTEFGQKLKITKTS